MTFFLSIETISYTILILIIESLRFKVNGSSLTYYATDYYLLFAFGIKIKKSFFQEEVAERLNSASKIRSQL